jgi:hypothetical protein
MKQGQGKMIRIDGSVYEGMFVAGKREGRGKYKSSADGSIYDGFWLNDRKNGEGKVATVTGNIYKGNWVDDKEEGEEEFDEKIKAEMAQMDP